MRVEGIEFVELSPGYFRMGPEDLARADLLGSLCALFGLPWGDQPEKTDPPVVRWQEIEAPFWIADAEITNGQFEKFDRDHKRTVATPTIEHPVIGISPPQAEAFCDWLTSRSSDCFRLPTEAEWEYACRAGTRSRYSFGDEPELLVEFGSCELNAVIVQRGTALATTTIRSHRPNAWGLYDMHGSAWECCAGSHVGKFSGGFTGGPFLVFEYEGSVLRGGGFESSAEGCRASSRTVVPDPGGPGHSQILPWATGFRPVLSMDECDR